MLDREVEERHGFLRVASRDPMPAPVGAQSLEAPGSAAATAVSLAMIRLVTATTLSVCPVMVYALFR